MADRRGPVVEPDHVAALQPPLPFDGAGDRNAEPAIGLAGDAGLAAPRGLAHVAEDHARRADDGRIADIDAVDGKAGAGGEIIDLGAEVGEQRGEALILRHGPGVVGPARVVQPLPFGIEPGLVDEGVRRPAQRDAPDPAVFR